MNRILITMLLLTAVRVHAAVKTEPVEYKDGKTVLQGTLAYDDSQTGTRPGVLVVHEWWGHNDYSKRRARQLAEMGYIAFAIDMYGKGVMAHNHEEAGKLAGTYRSDRNLMRNRAKAALDKFLTDPKVNKSKVAAIGYCFGGTTVLEMARAGMPLVGVASFHGSLDTPVPAQPGAIKAKILVLQGADDAWTMSGVPAFQDEMKKAGADWQLITYSNAVHGFTVPEAGNDPTKGMAYNETADKRSWEALKDFLAEVFK